MRAAPLTPMRAAVDTIGAESVALIGGMALGAHGVGRSTADADLLAVDRSLLQPERWDAARAAGLTVEVRRGDAWNPLVGVVRLGRRRSAPVDVVLVGDWMAPMLRRTAPPVRIRGVTVPLLSAADLVLLKLYAGGPLDLRDVEALLLRVPALAAIVEERLSGAPHSCRGAWARLDV